MSNNIEPTTGLIVPDGTIEGIKWLGLVLMIADHVNKYLYNEQLPGIFECGRIVMPLFAFTLAYNLARPRSLESGLYGRVMLRTFLYGLAATPFFIGLGGLVSGWWPLNIMFMLFVATVTVKLIEQGRTIPATIVLLLGGAFVEFWWFAIFFFIAAWQYCKKPSKAWLMIWLISAVPLYLINRNMWALAAMPLILAAPFIDFKIPRIRHIFYVFYPAHMAVLFAIVKL